MQEWLTYNVYKPFLEYGLSVDTGSIAECGLESIALLGACGERFWSIVRK